MVLHLEAAREFLRIAIASYVLVLVIAIAEMDALLVSKTDATHVRAMLLTVFDSVALAAAFVGTPSTPTGLFINLFLNRTHALVVLTQIAVQLVGAIMAIATVGSIMPRLSISAHLVQRIPEPFTERHALAMQVVVSFGAALSIVCGQETWRGPDAVRPLFAGAIAMAMAVMASSITGLGSFNIMRPTAPAVMAHDYRHIWLFWTGDLLGTALGVACAVLLCEGLMGGYRTKKADTPLSTSHPSAVVEAIVHSTTQSPHSTQLHSQ